MIILLGVLSLLQIADIWLTIRILREGGRELNPLMRRVMSVLGLVPGMTLLKSFGMVLILGLVYLFGWRWEHAAIACVLQLLIVLWNANVLDKQGG